MSLVCWRKERYPVLYGFRELPFSKRMLGKCATLAGVWLGSAGQSTRSMCGVCSRVIGFAKQAHPHLMACLSEFGILSHVIATFHLMECLHMGRYLPPSACKVLLKHQCQPVTGHGLDPSDSGPEDSLTPSLELVPLLCGEQRATKRSTEALFTPKNDTPLVADASSGRSQMSRERAAGIMTASAA